MTVTVLLGGESSERRVSIASGLRVTKALLSRGDHTATLDYRSAGLDTRLLPLLQDADAIFLALHGGAGEGGTLQAALEAAGLFHYTGSEALGAALAMDKARAKRAVAAAGVPVAAGAVWRPQEPIPFCPFPAVLKPLCGGSSVGLQIIKSRDELQGFSPTEPMLLESFLCGREYTVGVLEAEALPVVEIRPRGGVYDYERKYTAGAAEELCPAPISPDLTAFLQGMALRAFAALGLRDFARIDFKEDASGVPHFLEANTLPGLTETSLLPLAASVAGLDFPALCHRMTALAAARRQK